MISSVGLYESNLLDLEKRLDCSRYRTSCKQTAAKTVYLQSHQGDAGCTHVRNGEIVHLSKELPMFHMGRNATNEVRFLRDSSTWHSNSAQGAEHAQRVHALRMSLQESQT
jgi:hypothetical protein